MKMISDIKEFVLGTAFTLTSKIAYPHTIRLFRKLVYGWFLLNTFILLPAADKFWSQDALIPVTADKIPLRFMPFHLLNLNFLKYDYIILLVFFILLLTLGILCIYPRAVSILIYIVAINLDNRAYVILDGGNNLMQIILIYIVFMDPSLNKKKFKLESLNQLNNAASNLGLYLVQLQVVMVYLVSGLGKVDGTLWQNGTALYYTLNVDEYSHPLAKRLISSYPIISVLGTYSTLVYQLAFPWVIWIKKIRPYILLFGTFIHVQISFVMGLFMFGLAIATAYFSFTDDSTAQKLLEIPDRVLRKIKIVFKAYAKSREKCNT